MKVAIRDLKVADRVIYQGKEKLVAVVLEDKVFLRDEDSLTINARLLITKDFGLVDTTIEVVE